MSSRLIKFDDGRLVMDRRTIAGFQMRTFGASSEIVAIMVGGNTVSVESFRVGTAGWHGYDETLARFDELTALLDDEPEDPSLADLIEAMETATQQDVMLSETGNAVHLASKVVGYRMLWMDSAMATVQAVFESGFKMDVAVFHAPGESSAERSQAASEWFHANFVDRLKRT